MAQQSNAAAGSTGNDETSESGVQELSSKQQQIEPEVIFESRVTADDLSAKNSASEEQLVQQSTANPGSTGNYETSNSGVLELSFEQQLFHVVQKLGIRPCGAHKSSI